MKDIVIIGAGPAGLTAALYARREKRDLILIEKHLAGGQLLWTSLIENYPGFPVGISGGELALNMQKQVESAGIKIINTEVKSIKEDKGCFIVRTLKDEFETRIVIITTGALPKKLGIPNEEKFIGKGISFCAVCDGPLYKDKEIAVIGGGNAALEEALFLSKFASKVSLIHRRDEFRAVPLLREKVENNKKINILYNRVPVEILGSGMIEALKVKDVKTQEIDEIKIAGLFIFIGSKPNSEIVKNLVDTDKDGFIITDNEMKSSKDGIYAAGDIRSKKFKQVVLACSEGACAALTASKILKT